MSTCSNYGLNNKKNFLLNEESRLNPLSLYAKQKVEIEKFLINLKKNKFFSPCILRFATAFGLSERMRFDLTVNQFTLESFVKNKLLVYDSNTWRPYCHVLDFASLIEKVIEAPSILTSFEVFNAGGDENNFTKKMLVNCILDQIPHGKVKYGVAGADPRNYRVSFRKVKRVLRFEPKYSVEFGVSELITAFKEGKFSNVLDNPSSYGNFVINDAN